MSKPFRILRGALIILVSCVLAYAGVELIIRLVGYADGQASYRKTAALARATPTAAPRSASSAIPATSSPAPVTEQIHFPALMDVNDDTVGWLECAGTVIDYPVVQGEDNQYYLTHVFDKSENKMGAIFLDWRNRPDFSDSLSVLYGHNMDSGDMFADVLKYREQSFYEAHPTMVLTLPSQQEGAKNIRFQMTMLAAYEESGDEDPLRELDNFSAFRDYLEDVQSRSLFQPEETASYGDRLLLLSTCTYSFDDARLLLLGRLDELPD